MEWNKLLELPSSMLGGGTAGLPQLSPGPGQELTENPTPHLPFAVWRASPAYGAIQELIPDLTWFRSKLNKIHVSDKPDNQTAKEGQNSPTLRFY